ncbi:histidine phosphatase family protein [Bacillus sp. 03113]|uniref:histidine phosphatase family protein n=1 Tax=Bacillus sp. 03113 TaxID=2578211 RepID=UPI0011423904|nr:histidine phosphatase family protein [Bacillus sp. 03113]
MDDGMAITLFRHGLTEENERRAYIGWMDSPLSILGKTQLRSTNDIYDFVITSDLKRCLETANRLFPDLPNESIFELREMNFGRWEGKTYEQLKGNREYKEWLQNPFEVKPPDGESFQEFTNRVDHGWHKIIEKVRMNHFTNIAIVTHGGVIRYLLSSISNEKKGFWDWPVTHGNGYKLAWESKDAFRRGQACTLLQEVLLTVRKNG